MNKDNDTQPQQPAELGEQDLQQAQGGVLIGLLLPAVQKVRDAANRYPSTTPIKDGTSNTLIVGDGL